MAWSFTDLRYGWKIATGIALAGTTIYVANNTRWRVNQADVIELALGVDERVMALQTGTNAFGEPVYPIARPSFVRNWITNNYETQVVGGVTSVVAVAYTNTVTNTIGYRTDHAMMVELDTKLKAIVPYYVDTNTVYNGMTNVVMLTFTGLLTKLNIGDGTNFTRTPCWTNNVGETNCTTNAATYGELPWRIYVQDLQERYKVLNALSCRVVVPNKCDFAGRRAGDEWLAFEDWPGSTNTTTQNYLSGVDYSFTNDVYSNDGFPYYKKLHYYSSGFLWGSGTGTNPVNQFDSYLNASRVVFGTVLNSNLQASCDVYVKKILMWNGDAWPATQNYDDQGTGISEPDGWSLLESFSTKSGDLLKSTNYWGHDILINNPPAWCDTPTTNDVSKLYEGGRIWGTARGFSFNAQAVIKFQFNYATNKYW